MVVQKKIILEDPKIMKMVNEHINVENQTLQSQSI
jgi:hypothetical protein